jgi:hypothetical protein
MVVGPGKYDAECTFVRMQTKARGTIVIIVDGDRGNGFSCQGDPLLMAALPDMLETIARQIRDNTV